MVPPPNHNNGKMLFSPDVIPPTVKHETPKQGPAPQMRAAVTILENAIVHEHTVDDQYSIYHFDLNSNWIADAGDSLKGCAPEGCIEIDILKDKSKMSDDGKALVRLCNNKLIDLYAEIRGSVAPLLKHYYKAAKELAWYKTANAAGEHVSSKEIEYYREKDQKIIGGIALVDNNSDGLTDQFVYFDAASPLNQLTIVISSGMLVRDGGFTLKAANSSATSEFYKTYFSGFDSK